MLSHPQAVKSLSPGRVIVVDIDVHRNSLAIILQAGPLSSKDRTFMTLILTEQSVLASNTQKNESNKDSDWSLPQPVLTNQLFRPEGACGHAVIQVKTDNISIITTKTLKVNADKIVDDYRKRQIPRFKLVCHPYIFYTE